MYACLEKLQRAFRPELVVVKSIKMKALVLQCTPFECESRDAGDQQDTDGHCHGGEDDGHCSGGEDADGRHLAGGGIAVATSIQSLSLAGAPFGL